MDRYEIEKLYEVWDNTAGVCLRVGPDRDGLDMVEVKVTDDKSRDYFGNVELRINPDMAMHLAKALLEAAAGLIRDKRGAPDGNRLQ